MASSILRIGHSKCLFYRVENVRARKAWRCVVLEPIDTIVSDSFSVEERNLPHSYLGYVRTCDTVIRGRGGSYC